MPVAPASPRCWSSEGDFKQVRLLTLAPSGLPHSSSSHGSSLSALSHTLLRAAQVAMLAILGARGHLEHPLSQLELLYTTVSGAVGWFAVAGSSWPRER